MAGPQQSAPSLILIHRLPSALYNDLSTHKGFAKRRRPPGTFPRATATSARWWKSFEKKEGFEHRQVFNTDLPAGGPGTYVRQVEPAYTQRSIQPQIVVG